MLHLYRGVARWINSHMKPLTSRTNTLPAPLARLIALPPAVATVRPAFGYPRRARDSATERRASQESLVSVRKAREVRPVLPGKEPGIFLISCAQYTRVDDAVHSRNRHKDRTSGM